jgi:CDP-diacylglycerol---glycerol-3-phosphate 3-phosphatidyltransferase
MSKTIHHGWELPAKETLMTVASGVTLIRTLVAVAFAVLGAIHQDQTLLLIGLACYWVGDILDGIVARKMNHETRSGAIFDIMADRLCVALIYLIYAFMHQNMLVAVGLYLVEFMFIDGFLSLTFLFWPLLSPNYFFLVDRRIFNLNWSPLGKVANSSVFLLATLIFNQPLLSIGIVVAVTSIKIYSLVRLYKTVGVPSTYR